MLRPSTIRALHTRALAGLLAAASLFALSAALRGEAPSPAAHNSTAAVAAGRGPRQGVPVQGEPAFRVGEKLHYRISWAALMTAATAELSVTEKRSFYGQDAWHFRALARTTDLARSLYELDNQFDSYTGAETLASFRYEAYLREQGKKETHVVRMSGRGLPVQDDGAMVRVLPGTRDPLGVLYYLRTIDWSSEKEVRTPVFDGRRLFEIRATAGASEPVSVVAGTYPAASVVELRVFERRKELENVRFRVWFTADESRAPALIEAQLPFGKLRVELARATLTP